MEVKEKKYFTAWANLLDLGFETALKNLKVRKGNRLSLKELRESLARQSEEHLEAISKMLKRIK